MTERKLSATDAALRERITELSVHIPCGGLRDPLQRELNKGLMGSFINANILRASLDIRSSIVFLDGDGLFVYAVPELPDQETLDYLGNQTNVRYWSKGVA
jgi:hypothetical protein